MNRIHTIPILLARLMIPVALVVTASVTLWQDLAQPTPISVLCAAGFCREDQVKSAVSYTNLDQVNPYKWAAYAESLDTAGNTAGAAKAMKRALALGPAIAPIHMRAFNFHLIHEHSAEVLKLGRRILELTPAYNGLIFADFVGTPTAQILRDAIPPQSMADYLVWAQGARPTPELLEIWSWMRKNQLADVTSACGISATLWRRGEYEAAARLWAAWLPADRRQGYLQSNFLSNPRFRVPFKTPLDWAMDSPGRLETLQNDGLSISFPGTENLAYSNVSQMSFVYPGSYEFSAVVEGIGITTNEGPFFHLFDAEHPGKLNVVTEQLRGTVARRTVEVRFRVGPETKALLTQLERRTSEKLDGKIAGTLRIYEVSLRRID